MNPEKIIDEINAFCNGKSRQAKPAREAPILCNGRRGGTGVQLHRREQLEELESYEDITRYDLEKKEKKVIAKTENCVNKYAPIRTSDEKKDYNKAYQQNNREAIVEQRKKHYQDKKDIIQDKMKQYREKNKEELAEKKKKYREENKAHVSAVRKKYYEINKEKISAQKREQYLRKKLEKENQ